MSKNSKMTALAAAALLLDSFSLGGCASSTTASSMDAHAEAPVSPKTSSYLPLDLPPRDEKPAITAVTGVSPPPGHRATELRYILIGRAPRESANAC
jgi:hypothetical protein